MGELAVRFREASFFKMVDPPSPRPTCLPYAMIMWLPNALRTVGGEFSGVGWGCNAKHWVGHIARTYHVVKWFK